MSSGRKRFKILTHVKSDGTWPSSLQVPRLYTCPAYVVAAWCPKRRRFRIKQALAVGIPYSWSESRYARIADKGNPVDVMGQQLAAQNGLPWVKTFDPSWKLHDLMLMRLKGKV